MFRRGDFLLSYSSLGRMTKDVEVDSDTVYDWHTVLHLQLYVQGHTGKSSVPGMTSLSYIITGTGTLSGDIMIG